MKVEIRKAVLEATEDFTETWSNRFKAFSHADVIEEMVNMSDEGLIRIDPHRESTSGRREIDLVRVDGITGERRPRLQRGLGQGHAGILGVPDQAGTDPVRDRRRLPDDCRGSLRARRRQIVGQDEARL